MFLQYRDNRMLALGKMVPPERFELPTNRFEADYSIQLSYGGVGGSTTRQSAGRYCASFGR